MTTSDEKVFPCPRCKAPVHWDRDARWKPFCSERCKMVDLGAWFTEEHVIPGAPVEPGADGGEDEG